MKSPSIYKCFDVEFIQIRFGQPTKKYTYDWAFEYDGRWHVVSWVDLRSANRYTEAKGFKNWFYDSHATIATCEDMALIEEAIKRLQP